MPSPSSVLSRVDRNRVRHPAFRGEKKKRGRETPTTSDGPRTFPVIVLRLISGSGGGQVGSPDVADVQGRHRHAGWRRRRARRNPKHVRGAKNLSTTKMLFFSLLKLE